MKTITLFLLLISISLAEVSATPLLSLGIKGGVDHFNSRETEPVYSGFILWSPSSIYSLQIDSEKAHSFGTSVQSRWSISKILIIDASYHLRNFSSYDISEHNLSTTAGVNHKVRPIGVRARLGWNFRFTDFGDDFPYGQSFPTWEVTLLATPIQHRWDLALSFQNYHNAIPISYGYFETYLSSIWQLNQNFSIQFDTGISFSGIFALAGYVDRLFIEAGIRYEINRR